MFVNFNIFDYSNDDLLFSYWLRRKLSFVTGNQNWRGLETPNPDPLHVAIDKEILKFKGKRNINLPLFNFESDFRFGHFRKTESNSPKLGINEPPETFNDNAFAIEQKS